MIIGHDGSKDNNHITIPIEGTDMSTFKLIMKHSWHIAVSTTIEIGNSFIHLWPKN